MNVSTRFRRSNLPPLGLLAAALSVSACDDSLDLGDAGAAVGTGGSAGAGGSGGKGSAKGSGAGASGASSGGGGSAAGNGGGEAGKGGSGAAGKGGGQAGDGGSDAGAGGSDAGSGGSDAGAGGSDTGSGGSDAGLGGSAAGIGGSAAGMGGGTAGVGGAGAGVGGSAAGAAGVGGSAAGNGGGAAGNGGGGAGQAGGSGFGGTASAGAGGAGGAQACTKTMVTNVCSAPLIASTEPCWTPYTLEQGSAPSCLAQGGPSANRGHVARLSLATTSRVTIWRPHALASNMGVVFGLAEDDCGGGPAACVGQKSYGGIVTAELPAGDYQLQGTGVSTSPAFVNDPPNVTIEAPLPPDTNTTCAGAKPLSGAMATQPRVVDDQPRYFSYTLSLPPQSPAQSLRVRLRSPMNIGKAAVRVREECGGPVVAEGDLPYVLGGQDGYIVTTFSAKPSIKYILELVVTPGLIPEISINQL